MPPVALLQTEMWTKRAYTGNFIHSSRTGKDCRRSWTSEGHNVDFYYCVKIRTVVLSTWGGFYVDATGCMFLLLLYLLSRLSMSVLPGPFSPPLLIFFQKYTCQLCLHWLEYMCILCHHFIVLICSFLGSSYFLETLMVFTYFSN